jgi:transcription elongation GreA/GreB family factor
MATLDIINAVVGHTEEHMRHQNEQNLSYQAELDGLRRDLGQVKERLQAAEMRAHQAQVHADIRLQRAQAEANSQVQIIRAESEARVRTIRAVMDAQMREAEERVRIADLRASTAEQWLQRIDVAAKELLLRVI